MKPKKLRKRSSYSLDLAPSAAAPGANPLDSAPQPTPLAGIRLGLCCQFVDQPGIRYRTTTAAYLARRPAVQARQQLRQLAEHNATTLRDAILACAQLGIHAYRIPSRLLPLGTHPDWFYSPDDLPERALRLFDEAKSSAKGADIRLSFHPDQFVVLGSPRDAVTQATLHDLRLHGQLAELVGADVINVHAGGGYGDKPRALERVARTLELLPPGVRERITLENDDRIFHVADLLPLCRREGVPLTYDVHHHRCLPDGLTVADATSLAAATWNREPIFHLSSPRGGWIAANPRLHDDFIDPTDFPAVWRGMRLTVDVEAKLKERALFELRENLARADRRSTT